MMKQAIEKLRNSIRSEAEAEASHILREAREQLVSMLAEAGREEEQRARALIEEERSRCDQQMVRDISQSQRAARLEALAARNRVLEEIFLAVRKEIQELPAERYGKLLRVWVRELDAPEGGELAAGRKDSGLLREIVAELNASRPPAARIKVSGDAAPFERGFIFRTPRFEIERSLSAWIEEQKREMAPELEHDLFRTT
ncbi:MAG: V-type ATP synthase subunit E [Candidatus Aureabacteria bacterium]|nr:V-type ATP synthase subunit E [Candidatus Auribacterota bacterium]